MRQHIFDFAVYFWVKMNFSSLMMIAEMLLLYNPLLMMMMMMLSIIIILRIISSLMIFMRSVLRLEVRIVASVIVISFEGRLWLIKQ